MAKTNPETIVLRGDVVYLEADAGGAITPGHMLTRSAADTVVVHNSAGGAATKLFARENDIAGDDITHAYANGERVLMFAAPTGSLVYGILADGENAVVGALLESNGNGELRVVDADTSVGDIGVGSIVGQALEAVDASDSATTAVADRRVKVEIM